MLDTTPELFDAHIAVNLKAQFFIMADTIRHLRERGIPGSIVNIISIAELGGQSYLAPYMAAKAGLAGVTRNAAYAHRWDKIRINGIDIGWTATEAEAKIQTEEHGAGMTGWLRPTRPCRWGRSADPNSWQTSRSTCCPSAPVSSPAR